MCTSLLAGCDVEYLEYEDDDTYALFDRPDMAPATPAEVNWALGVIAAGGPTGNIPVAYSLILDFIGVTIAPEDISLATFTVEEVGDKLEEAGMQFAEIVPAHKVIELLQAAIREYKKPGFAPEDPRNATLAALVSSLASRGVTNAAQVNGDTELSHGDFLLLVVSIYQSHNPDPTVNTFAILINEVLEDNGIPIAEKGLPDLETFMRVSTGVQTSAPHQGVITGG